MRRAYIVLCLVVTSALLPVYIVARQQATFGYELRTEPAGARFARNSQTTYTYYRTYGENRTELWRITMPGEYVQHWVERDGHVWMLVRNTRFDGSKGSADTLWIRDTEAREVGSLSLVQALYATHSDHEPNKQGSHPSLKLEGSKLLQPTPFKSRLVLDYGEGLELHINKLYDNDGGFINVATLRESSEDNALERILDRETSFHSINPIPGRKDIEFWFSSPGSDRGVLTEYAYWPMQGASAIRVVKAMSEEQAAPAAVHVTPNKRVLWFSFGGYAHTSAHLDVLELGAKLVGRIDFVKNGMFSSAFSAEKALDYTRIVIKRGSGWHDLERVEGGSYDQPEVIGFADYANHFYQVTIPSQKDKDAEVTIERRLASTIGLKKEPDYPGFERTSEQVWKSMRGTYGFRVRKFKNASGRELTQQTLLRYQPDGSEHEFWSSNLYSDVLDVFVTETGRALIIVTGETKNATTERIEQFVRMHLMDYQGRGILLNLADNRLLGSLDAARAAQFHGLEVEYQGDVQRYDFEGDDVHLYPTEIYTWKQTDGSATKFSLTAPFPYAFPSIRFLKQSETVDSTLN